MKKNFLIASLFAVATASCPSALATEPEIVVSPNVTSLIVMPENIRMVDISTPCIIGNNCVDNIVRIKPVNQDSIGRSFREGEILASITIIGERNISIYNVSYTNDALKATKMHKVGYHEMSAYSNPEVEMSLGEMSRFAWAVFGSSRKFNNITYKGNGLKAVVNNIYAVGNFFFLDYSLVNRTNIPYDLNELRVKLCDKNEAKATNSQTLELTPIFSLNDAKSFKKNYRNVIVLDKLTFPENKVLTLEVAETQISGRGATIFIDYDDILHADTFDPKVMKNLKDHSDSNITASVNRTIREVNERQRKVQGLIGKAEAEIAKGEAMQEDANKKEREAKTLKADAQRELDEAKNKEIEASKKLRRAQELSSGAAAKMAKIEQILRN